MALSLDGELTTASMDPENTTLQLSSDRKRKNGVCIGGKMSSNNLETERAARREKTIDILSTIDNQLKIFKSAGECVYDAGKDILKLKTPGLAEYHIGPGAIYLDVKRMRRGPLVQLAARLFYNGNEERAEDEILKKYKEPRRKVLSIDDPKEKRQQPEKPNFWTAESILQTYFSDPDWIIPGILPQGSTIMSGSPKGGKSWAMLDVATTLSTGGQIFGDRRLSPGRSLYLALEDTPRRLKNRLIKQAAHPSSQCHIVTEWPRDHNSILLLHEFMDEYPDTKLIIIDTLARFANIRDGNDYAEMTNTLAGIKAIADYYNIAIVIVHHTRKTESDDFVHSSLGSTGITGAVDTILVLKKKRGTNDAKLSVTGRDVEEHEYAMKFNIDTCRWSIIGDAHDVAETAAQQEILNLLKMSPEPMTPKMISDALGKNPSTVRGLIQKLVMSDRVHKHLDGKSYSSLNMIMGIDGKLHDTTDATDGQDRTDTTDGTDRKAINE